MTQCDSDIPPGETNPTLADGCRGTGLRLVGPETNESQTLFEHGVPEIKGYFAVDVTGALHQGVSPIDLTPVTFEQARRGAAASDSRPSNRDSSAHEAPDRSRVHGVPRP
jgi:hypothetical protein